MRSRLLVPAAIAIATVSACTNTSSTPGGMMPAMSSASMSARAMVRDASGRDLGTLLISETTAGLMTSGTLRGLAPGAHGIHIHMVGRCEAPFATAGGHWNPAARQHGFDNPQGPHMGDMRNITVGADSAVTVNVSTPGGMLHGASGLLDSDGASVVVHATADDYRTDPAGNSGARIACGVVAP